jgi:hypothetical protein
MRKFVKAGIIWIAKAFRFLYPWLIRTISVSIGLWIEYHEVFQVKSAQTVLVFLGLWFIVVPPAQALDTWRRVATVIESMQESSLKQAASVLEEKEITKGTQECSEGS